MEPDFGGYATKAGLKCSDGRTITAEAFKHMDGMQVPLVWQHVHNSGDNVLGHGILEARDDGMYVRGFFNKTKQGQNAKALVEHKDVSSLSIYANNLVEKSKTVLHGMIREVSLVLSGANPGAKIDYVRIQHSSDPDDVTEIDDEAIIHTGLNLDVEYVEDENEGENLEHAEDDDPSLEEIIETMDEKQKEVLFYMVGVAADGGGDNSEEGDDGNVEHSDNNDEGDLEHQEGNEGMTRNVFEQQDGSSQGGSVQHHALSHSDMKTIVNDAQRLGSLKDAVEQFALKHGIDDIEVLFPDAKALSDRPDFNKRRTEWVDTVLSSTSHSPFSRVKTVVADLTQEEARARGYIKGNYKTEEWFGVSKRTTAPTTLYKKQKLDRDDVVDITDFDVVVWLKAEMRMMLEEELARAILISDGRDVSSEDKIKDPIGAADGVGIRSIKNDHELYVTHVNVNVNQAGSNYDEVVDAVMDAMEYYKGSGTPTFYTTIRTLNKFLQVKDAVGRRMYRTKAEVAEALGVADVVTVEPMNDEPDLLGIIVNLRDYNIGADKGGEVSLFDDFDIDYNQYKYLIETRLSGALTKIKSAIVIHKTESDDVALEDPTAPTFNKSTWVVTIPSMTGVVYKNADTGATLSAGAQTALTEGQRLNVKAVAASGYYFPINGNVDWTFYRRA